MRWCRWKRGAMRCCRWGQRARGWGCLAQSSTGRREQGCATSELRGEGKGVSKRWDRAMGNTSCCPACRLHGICDRQDESFEKRNSPLKVWEWWARWVYNPWPREANVISVMWSSCSLTSINVCLAGLNCWQQTHHEEAFGAFVGMYFLSRAVLPCTNNCICIYMKPLMFVHNSPIKQHQLGRSASLSPRWFVSEWEILSLIMPACNKYIPEQGNSGQPGLDNVSLL